MKREIRAREIQLLAAQKIQEHLLPKGPPVVPGFDIAGALYAARPRTAAAASGRIPVRRKPSASPSAGPAVARRRPQRDRKDPFVQLPIRCRPGPCAGSCGPATGACESAGSYPAGREAKPPRRLANSSSCRNSVRTSPVPDGHRGGESRPWTATAASAEQRTENRLLPGSARAR
jgi:hypothetical protein